MASERKIKKDGLAFKLIEELLYIIFVLAGIYLAFLLKFSGNPPDFNINPFIENIPYIIIATILIFNIYDIVSTFKKTVFENMLIIGISLVLIDMAIVAIVFFMRGFAFPRSVFLIGFILQFLLIFSTKMLILGILKRKEGKSKIIIIGNEQEASYIEEKILSDKFIHDQAEYLCNPNNINIYKLINKVDKVYIASGLDTDIKSEIVSYCMAKNKTLYLVPGLFEISLINFKVTQVSDMLLFKLQDLELTYEKQLMKRALDLIISVIGIIITSPLMIITAVAIKLYDGGPILFKQKRVTKNNITFNLYKFRTMIVDAEKQTGPVMATDKDPRITPVGRLLRSSRIDELPQFFNVFSGRMSIVGPRPERPFFADQFNSEIEEFKYRTFVKAGVTGLAQIMGRYTTSPQDKAKYDLLYIKNYSLILDIKIIFNTIKIMFIKDSSSGNVQDREGVEENRE